MDLWQIHLCLYEIKRDDEPVAQLEGVHKHKVGVLNHATHHFSFFNLKKYSCLNADELLDLRSLCLRLDFNSDYNKKGKMLIRYLLKNKRC